jgi:hypothetical protein
MLGRDHPFGSIFSPKATTKVDIDMNSRFIAPYIIANYDSLSADQYLEWTDVSNAPTDFEGGRLLEVLSEFV